MPKIQRQSHFLYDHKWSPAMDTLCLSTILANTNKEVWAPPYDPLPHAIACALADLNRAFGKELTYDVVQERLDFLKERYETFKKIVNLPESHWNVKENVIFLQEAMWAKMFMENNLSKAFYYNGEPEFRLLELIFGHDTVKIEKKESTLNSHFSHTVINISDDTDRVEEHGPILVEDSEEDDVTSPILRRRLFDDRESTNQRDTNLAFPTRNAFPPPPQDSQFTYFNPGNSSCGSSDPFNWG